MELNDKELEEYNKLNNKTTKKEVAEHNIKDNMNWIMIAVLAIMMVVLSCLSSVNGNIQFVFPETAWGWVLLVAPKLVIAVLGYMIWTNFFDKGKQTASKTDEYKQAQKILSDIQGKTDKNIIDVVNPVVWEKKTKIKKGIKVTITTALTTFVIAELVVSFSIASLVGTLVSLLISAVWGLQMMTDAEEKYSIGYLRYASLLKVQSDHKKEQDKQNALPKPECVPMEPYGAQDEQTRPDVLPSVDN